MTADELYLSNLMKLYPNMNDKELNVMFKEFKTYMDNNAWRKDR
jgi:hypothetical protein